MITSNRVRDYLAVAGLYVAMAASAGEPIQCPYGVCGYTYEYLILTTLCLTALSIVKAPRHVVVNSFAFLVILCLPIFFALLSTEKPLFVGSKLWGAFVATYLGTCFLASILYRSGITGFSRSIQKILLLILALTLLYKLNFGLLDRNVRFLFNGPIVFGWWMGFASLIAFADYMNTRSQLAKRLFPFFVIAMVWTQSKGPIIAFTICVMFSLILNRHWSKRQLSLIVGGTAVIFGAIYWYFDINFADNRIGALAHIFLSGGDIDAAGSVGIRYLMYEQTMGVLVDNLFFGIGAGNFVDYFRTFTYPHNVHYEILLEWGLLAFMFYAVAVIASIKLAPPTIRLTIVFFAICLTFSGDASYLRYILPFVCFSLFHKYYMKRARQ